MLLVFQFSTQTKVLSYLFVICNYLGYTHMHSHYSKNVTLTGKEAESKRPSHLDHPLCQKWFLHGPLDPKFEPGTAGHITQTSLFSYCKNLDQTIPTHQRRPSTPEPLGWGQSEVNAFHTGEGLAPLEICMPFLSNQLRIQEALLGIISIRPHTAIVRPFPRQLGSLRFCN